LGCNGSVVSTSLFYGSHNVWTKYLMHWRGPRERERGPILFPAELKPQQVRVHSFNHHIIVNKLIIDVIIMSRAAVEFYFIFARPPRTRSSAFSLIMPAMSVILNLAISSLVSFLRPRGVLISKFIDLLYCAIIFSVRKRTNLTKSLLFAGCKINIVIFKIILF